MARHPALVGTSKLLALFNFQARRQSLPLRVSPGISSSLFRGCLSSLSSAATEHGWSADIFEASPGWVPFCVGGFLNCFLLCFWCICWFCCVFFIVSRSFAIVACAFYKEENFWPQGYELDRLQQKKKGIFVWRFVTFIDTSVIGASFYDWMRTLVTGILNPMTTLHRSSSFSSAPSMIWLRKGLLVFHSLDLGR